MEDGECSIFPYMKRVCLWIACSSLPLFPATITVSTNADSGAGSLRTAITTANTNGDTTNTISINSGLGTITLASYLPLINPPDITAKTLSIVGPSGGQVISGASAYRGFFVTAGTVSFENITVQNATATGGAGGGASDCAAGGGGGAGLGAGLLVHSGTVTATNCSFSSCASVGGAGGAGVAVAAVGGGGGGGGLHGAGGRADSQSTVNQSYQGGGGGGFYGAGGHAQLAATARGGSPGGGGFGGRGGNNGSADTGGCGGGGLVGRGGDAGASGGGTGGGGTVNNGTNGPAAGDDGTAGGTVGGGGGGGGFQAFGGAGGGGGATAGSNGGAAEGGAGGSGGTGGGGGGAGGGYDAGSSPGGAGGTYGGGGGAGADVAEAATDQNAGDGGWGGGGGGANNIGGDGGFYGGGGGGGIGTEGGGTSLFAGGGGGCGSGPGGAGGYGGGGGAGTTGGTSTFGGGSGGTTSSSSTGGGGAALGGGIFIRSGTLAITDSSFSSNTTTGGTGANSGAALGNDLFIESGATTTVSVGSGNSQSMSIGSDNTGGVLVKTGTGTLNLTGSIVSPRALDTMTVSTGTLAVNGAIRTTGGTTVASGATIKGVGPLTSLVTVNGTMAPGNSIDTMVIVGDYEQTSGSTLAIELNTTTSDKVAVTGNVTINSNATLSVIVTPGSYASTQTYTIITNTGTHTGEFGTVTIDLANYAAIVDYSNANRIDLILSLVLSTRTIYGHNPPIVARTLEEISATGDLANIITILWNISGAWPFTDALNQLQPANLNGATLSQQANTTQAVQLLMHRLQDLYRPCCVRETRDTVWVDGFGGRMHNSGIPLFNGVVAKTYGFMGGADVKTTAHHIVGLLGGYSSSSLQWENNADSGRLNTGYYGAYGGYFIPHFDANFALIGSISSIEATRHISFSSIQRNATSNHAAYGMDGHFDAGFPIGPCQEVRPYGSLDVNYIYEAGFTERGADSLNLEVEGRSSVVCRAQFGINYFDCFSLPAMTVAPEIFVGYAREQRYCGNNITATFVNTSIPMHLITDNPNRNLFSILLGAKCYDRNRFSASLFYEGDFGGRYSNQTGTLECKFAF